MNLATLPMYDLPELRQATDALWAAIAARLKHRGVAAPEALSRGPALAAMWVDHRLLLGQTCGYPLVTSLAGKVVLIATPFYLADGCEGACYRSAVVVRKTDGAASLADLRGRRCAVNERNAARPRRRAGRRGRGPGAGGGACGAAAWRLRAGCGCGVWADTGA